MASALVANNDINATAAAIEVEGDEPEMISIHVAPAFWEFFFSPAKDRTLRASRTGVGLKTFVRLAYKSFQMQIPYSKEDPDGNKFMNAKEKFFSSHKKKIEEINEKWGAKSPFHNYSIVSKQGAFYLKSLSKKIDCGNCMIGKANKSCVQSFCKKCCVKTDVKCSAHKTKKKEAPREEEETT